jgi:hypothetical protein
MYKDCAIKGFEGLYHIYPDHIYSVRKKRIVKTHTNNNYQYVCLTDHEGQQLRTGIHRIIAHHWISPQPESHIVLGRYEINHKDCDKFNNHYSNLEWVTHSANIQHARGLIGNWSKGRQSGFNVSRETRFKMSLKKYKPVLLFNDSQSINIDSMALAADYLKTSLRQVQRYISTNKPLNGFIIKPL